jgi:regulator of sirC expression with transglutaminase-like and TPR domain
MSAPRDRLEMICSRPESEWDLAEAALLVAAAEYPDLDPRDGLETLDDIGRRAAARLRGTDPRERALALARFLHDVERFDGNREDYNDPRNSYLNDVLERRLGLPILLSLVYCEVARRAGVTLEGVGLPGHFIVKVPGPAELFIDPFNGGSVLSVEDCAERIKDLYGGNLAFSREMLRSATTRGTLARLIRNLKGIYAVRKDLERTWRVTDLVLCVEPDAAEEIRDRGLLSLHLKRHLSAAIDLERYLELRPDSADKDLVVDGLRSARRAMAEMN